MVTLTAANAVIWLSALLVAVTVMLVAGGTEGAVSRPFAEMLPAVVIQDTPDSLVPLTVALNCSDAPGTTVAFVGEIVRLI